MYLFTKKVKGDLGCRAWGVGREAWGVGLPLHSATVVAYNTG